MGTLIVIGGPTASGKTALSIELAQRLNAEIFSADSRQFYRGMDIGTAKPSTEEQSQATHHFIDHKNPDEAYTAGDFEADCIPALEDYFKARDYAILVGGSGLYIKAITDGFDPLPSSEDAREKWNTAHAEKGLANLRTALKEKDPEYAAKVDMNNPHRLIRALEVIDATGKPYSAQRSSQPIERSFNIAFFCLAPPRDLLYERINKRTEEMIAQGLEQEVRSLMHYRECNALKTVGYREMLSFIDGDISIDKCVASIKQHTRNYAKRQLTWFKNQSKSTFIEKDYQAQILKHLNED